MCQVPADAYLAAHGVCQQKGLCLILVVFTFNQENIPSLCLTQPIQYWGRETVVKSAKILEEVVSAPTL